MSRFAPADMNTVAFLVDVVQGQRSDFTRTQTIRDQEQEDCIVALADNASTVNFQQHLLDFVPCNRARQI